jgi:hypothetical protein
VTSLPDYSPAFPQWPKMAWSKICPALDADGVDFIKGLLSFDPYRRMTAKAACAHRFLAEVVPAAGAAPSPAALAMSPRCGLPPHAPALPHRTLTSPSSSPHAQPTLTARSAHPHRTLTSPSRRGRKRSRVLGCSFCDTKRFCDGGCCCCSSCSCMTLLCVCVCVCVCPCARGVPVFDGWIFSFVPQHPGDTRGHRKPRRRVHWWQRRGGQRHGAPGAVTKPRNPFRRPARACVCAHPSGFVVAA